MEAFIGTILVWPVSWAPLGWRFCDGSSLNISEAQGLFGLIGFTYGGNGQSTFKLPDLRGKVPLGAQPSGNPSHPLATVGGAASSPVTGTANGAVLLQPANLPPHTHPASLSLAGLTSETKVQVSTGKNGTTVASNNAVLSNTADSGPPSAAIFLPAGTAPTNPITLGGVSTAVLGSGSVTVDANTGGGQPLPVSLQLTGVTVPTMPPYQVLNYIICLEGLYPNRP